MINKDVLIKSGEIFRDKMSSAFTPTWKGKQIMLDKEKVINGLREMSCRATWKDIDRIRHKFQQIINDAVTLLKEKEPNGALTICPQKKRL